MFLGNIGNEPGMGVAHLESQQSGVWSSSITWELEAVWAPSQDPMLKQKKTGKEGGTKKGREGEKRQEERGREGETNIIN